MATKKIAPARKIEGLVDLPGDKSISHRYAILASLAEGTSEIQNYSTSADCHSTLECLKRLGVPIETRVLSSPQTEGDPAASAFVPQQQINLLRIGGRGLDSWKEPRTLDAENSGTTMRLLAGALSGQRFPSEITGDSSLRKRPMRRILDPLRAMGANIKAKGDAYAPLQIKGAALHGIEYAGPLASAQVKSCVLLAGLFAEGETTVREPVVTRDHLETALREFGARVIAIKGSVKLYGRPKLEARALSVPGDLSSAIFFIAAALILPGSNLTIHNVGLNPTRTRVLDFLIGMGASIHVASVQMLNGELVGNLVVRNPAGDGSAQGKRLTGGTIRGVQVAEMIDELPMLAALAPFTENGIDIGDASELRLKESDRISALADALRAIGAQAAEFPDGLRVEGRGKEKLTGAKINPRGDHRIAMAMAIAALGATAETTIKDSQCVGVSFPEFFPLLDRLVER